MREYTLADSADDAEECSKLHYFAEKDSLFKIKAVLLFWGFVCVNLRDLRETLGFLLSTLTCLFSRRLRRLRRGIQHGCIISQRKTDWDGSEVVEALLFCCLSA